VVPDEYNPTEDSWDCRYNLIFIPFYQHSGREYIAQRQHGNSRCNSHRGAYHFIRTIITEFSYFYKIGITRKNPTPGKSGIIVKKGRPTIDGKSRERLGLMWKKYIEWNRPMKIFLTGLLAVLFFIAAIRVSIDFKMYDGLLVLVIVLILLAATFWINNKIEKPS